MRRLSGGEGDITALEVALRESQERARESEARFRDFADSIPQLAWEADAQGSVVWFNRRWFEYTGTTPGQMRGWGWRSVHHPDHLERVVERIGRCFETGEPWEDTFPLRGRDGRYRWFLSRAMPIRDERGRVVRWFGTNTDVTERRRAEEAQRQSEARFRQLADAMPQVVWSARPDGELDYCNVRAREISGLSPREDGLWDWQGAVHPDDLEAACDAWRRSVRGGEPYEMSYRLRRADGSYHWYLARAVPARDDGGAVVRWYGTTTDIDAQKVAEERLRELDARKNEFLAMLSHELRNPLAPIRNSVFVLERAQPGGEQAQRAREIIDRQVRHLTRLVDDLLDVTRISRGKIRLRRERTDLRELVRRVAEDHRAVFAASELGFEARLPAEPLFVDGDAVRLAQVIGNLLANAAKFTPAGGRVSLSLEAGGGAARVRVEDTGAGVAPELAERLFEPFVQAHQTIDRSRGGLGLGLALVKALVEMHGGEVALRSEGPGRGSAFTVQLPLLEAPRAVPGPAAGPRRVGQGRRVLVVEDNPDAAETLRDLLELCGHAVQVARTGPEGLAKARALEPDVVLCDLGLPGMDGFDLARALRAEPAGRAVALVALSGYAAPEDVERALAAGFDRHLSKPVDLGELERVLAEARAGARGPAGSDAVSLEGTSG